VPKQGSKVSAKRPGSRDAGKSAANLARNGQAKRAPRNAARVREVIAKPLKKPLILLTTKRKPGVVPLRGAKLVPVAAVKPVKSSTKSKKRFSDEDEESTPRPIVPLPPPPVTTDSKPKKNQAGLSPRELDEFRALLLQKRRELLGDVSSMEREALQSGQGSNLSNLPVHMADMGTDNYEQEFTLGLVEKDRQLLREINQALAKIQDGSYGICEGTGKAIPKARLEIQPWARYSVEWARQLEKNMMLRR
jgi:DnaK suppressor protein